MFGNNNEEVKVVSNDLDNGIDNQALNNQQDQFSSISRLSMDNNTESALEELCPISGDVVVAYDIKQKRLVCNQCIYKIE